ncbi:class I SAM-dependent methyltransferase [Azotobacter salinestris]|uniref:class I SAM-dependent methyltransferase n=1 Tax=Azotobacter salinestris TaxID=69964 RepID=UPI0032E03CD2
MMESFYRAFEERHRGSRELIKERQAVYLSFIEPLKALYSSCPALDLGCGRGEWLEILLENGFEARGVDLDQGMLEVCSTLNLPAEQGEALDTLRRLADESQVLVSGLHIVEHMPFECLQQLVAEALRVLKPAGLLILESPNTENLVVGTNSFYFDPTHERPVPHPLLSFLTEHTGFARFKLLRLQEPKALVKAERIALMNVLAGVSPDYAIVAQKAAPAEQMALFDSAFDKEYGVALDTLAKRYDDGLQEEFDRFRKQLEETGARAREVEAALRGSIARTIQAEVKQAAVETLNETLRQQTRQAASEASALREQAHQLDVQLQQARQQFAEAQHHAQHWHLQASAYEAQAKDVLNSTSWRVTKPLRVLMIGLRRLGRSPSYLMRRLLRPVLARAMRWIMARPGLKQRLADRLRRHPVLFQRLRLFALNRGLLGAMSPGPQVAENIQGEDLSTLTPRARQIYTSLRKDLQERESANAYRH